MIGKIKDLKIFNFSIINILVFLWKVMKMMSFCYLIN